MTRPHLLYTAWSFPPSRAGGVYRALATVNAFAEAGWDVTVITVPREMWEESTGADAVLEARVDARVSVVRIEAGVPAYQNDISTWPRGRARHPELWKIADLIAQDFRRFPEPSYGRWRKRLQQTACEIHEAKPVDLAIGTGNPHVDFIPGWYLNRKYGVRHVMDYRDAWQLDVFSGERLITAIPPVRIWESRLMKTATEIWFVNGAIRDWHAREHPRAAAKMKVVANGYDEYDVPLATPIRAERGTGLVFGYIGTISEKVPLVELLQGWSIARRRQINMRNAKLILHGYIGHFGSVKVEFAEALENAKAAGVEFAGPVSKASIGKAYRCFDALVLALGTGRYVTSGKVFEYAATGIPIVSIHDPGNAATEVLRESPAWTATRSLDPADIADSLCNAANIALSQTAEERVAAQKWAAKFGRNSQLRPRILDLSPGSRV